MIKNKKIYGEIAILVLSFVAGMYFGGRTKQTPSVSTEIGDSSREIPSTVQEGVGKKKEIVSPVRAGSTLQLTAGATTLALPVTGESLFSIINAAEKRGEIVFSGKEYSGLGFFVTTIGTLTEGSGKHLLYSINGKEASVGVSLYIPKAGDVVVWELK